MRTGIASSSLRELDAVALATNVIVFMNRGTKLRPLLRSLGDEPASVTDYGQRTTDKSRLLLLLNLLSALQVLRLVKLGSVIRKLKEKLQGESCGNDGDNEYHELPEAPFQSAAPSIDPRYMPPHVHAAIVAEPYIKQKGELGFRVPRFGCRVLGAGCRVSGLRSWVPGSISDARTRGPATQIPRT